MADKEVRKFSRKELLELVIKQERENAALRQRIAECERELARRQIAIRDSGTMAEAALKLNKVFEAADEAVRQYLENVVGKAAQPPVSAPERVPEDPSAADVTEWDYPARQPGKYLKKRHW